MEITKLGHQLQEPGKLEHTEIHRGQIKTMGYRKGERRKKTKKELLIFCQAWRDKKEQ